MKVLESRKALSNLVLVTIIAIVAVALLFLANERNKTTGEAGAGGPCHIVMTDGTTNCYMPSGCSGLTSQTPFVKVDSNVISKISQAGIACSPA